MLGFSERLWESCKVFVYHFLFLLPELVIYAYEEGTGEGLVRRSNWKTREQ